MSGMSGLLSESRVYAPSASFASQANLSAAKYQALCDEAASDYTGYWSRLANTHIDWKTPFNQVLDEADAPFYRWFSDGELNVSYNCLDRHVALNGNKTAIIFEADDGTSTAVSYQALLNQVCAFANALKQLGLQQGDRVVIYLPMGIQAVVAMQACARLGIIHSVVFGGFSAKSLQERIQDAGAKLVITADGQMRGGKAMPLKPAVDEAIAMGGCESVQKVVVYQRTGQQVTMGAHDLWWHEAVAGQSNTCEPVWVNAEHPLFLLYTSGSTGTPKGVQHASAGYLLQALLSMLWTFDVKADDVFWCTADVGWITGHSYVAYGPLAAGITQVIFEGIPTYPDAGRFWKMIENHKVSIFYTAPTAIRSLIKLGADLPKQYDLTSLRLLGSVGEPINPEAWMWYYQEVGGGRCPIVDTWWQTETGAHMLTPLPGVTSLKPGSCCQPFPGIQMAVVDEANQAVKAGENGVLVIQKPWPSMIRTIWNNPERYASGYFPPDYQGAYLAGDGACIDADGYFWIMGRIDDVLNVSGHRLGTMEIESALVGNTMVAEAAVVGKPHEIKGEAVVAYVVLKDKVPDMNTEVGREQAKHIVNELRNWVGKEIGPIAKPDEIRLCENLPKTRSGKIMRRLLRSIARGEEITADISTLDNPAIIQQLMQVVS